MQTFLKTIMSHFNIIMAILVLVSLIAYCLDKFVFTRKREHLANEFKKGNSEESRQQYSRYLAKIARTKLSMEEEAALNAAIKSIDKKTKNISNHLYWLEKPMLFREKWSQYIGEYWKILTGVWLFYILFVFEPEKTVISAQNSLSNRFDAWIGKIFGPVQDALEKVFEVFMTHFELILTFAVLICFLFYIFDAFTFAGERKRLRKRLKSGEADATDRQDYFMRLEQAERNGIKKKYRPFLENTREALANNVALSGHQLHWAKKPVYPLEKFIEFFSGMFWILFFVWFARSFLYEPFRIPSGSMEPTLYDGDFILTSKFAYGVRLPVLRTKIIETGKVERGDVIVFRYPPNESLNYIKRVVAVPGDKMRVEAGRVWLNDVEQPVEFAEKIGDFDVFRETLEGRSHHIQFAGNDAQRIRLRGEVVIPEGKYFVMGDNRDNSQDSRYWGFVPDENVVGKALVIWMNADCVKGRGRCGRIGDGIR